jgi:hypothetical protein
MFSLSTPLPLSGWLYPLATMRTAGCMKKSAEVMEKMNKLCTAPQLQRSMMVMAREMEKVCEPSCRHAA